MGSAIARGNVSVQLVLLEHIVKMNAIETLIVMEMVNVLPADFAYAILAFLGQTVPLNVVVLVLVLQTNACVTIAI
jgi:hypothetical protein